MLLNAGLRPAIPTIAAMVKSVPILAKLTKSSSPQKHLILLLLSSFFNDL